MRKGYLALSLFGILLAIIALVWYIGVKDQRSHDEEMIQRNCFPLGVEWDEQKQDYNTWPPTGWDCSRDRLGEPKSTSE